MVIHDTTQTIMLPRSGNNASFISTLMGEARVKASSIFRFLHNKQEDIFRDDDCFKLDNVLDDRSTGINGIPLDFLFEEERATPVVQQPPPLHVSISAPTRSRTMITTTKRNRRKKVPRMNQRASVWWKLFLTPIRRATLLTIPNGRLHKLFRKLFHVPYDVFLDLTVLARERWWQDHNEDNRCRAGKLVASLDLQILGALFVLAQGVSHVVCSISSNISEEVHRSFFIEWIHHMASVKDEFIFMPHDDDTLRKVTDEYAARGLPGCVGSIDCVHIGWDNCPTQYKNMYTGKEGFPSVAYEVICSCRKFIQSVTCGHPGTRNDKHIAKTDASVMQLMDFNGWLNSKAWHCSGEGGRKTFYGHYLICDGGYHSWPCLMYPSKRGLPNSAEMRWSKNVESVRKDIEGVFGILKKRFRFLKNFNNLRRQSSVDDAFTTCCILHNMMLDKDGYLDEDLAPYPGGLEETLERKFGKNRWNGLDGLWIRDGDNGNTERAQNLQVLPPLVALPTPRFFLNPTKEH